MKKNNRDELQNFVFTIAKTRYDAKMPITMTEVIRIVNEAGFRTTSKKRYNERYTRGFTTQIVAPGFNKLHAKEEQEHTRPEAWKFLEILSSNPKKPYPWDKEKKK